MTQTGAPTKARAAPVVQARQVGPPQARPPKAVRKRHLSPFWRHFLEMLGAMASG